MAKTPQSPRPPRGPRPSPVDKRTRRERTPEEREAAAKARRRKYFREKKRIYRQRERQLITCRYGEGAYKQMQRLEMRARRFATFKPAIFLHSFCGRPCQHRSFRPYMRDKFSTLLSLRELVTYKIFPSIPVLLYYSNEELARESKVMVFLSEEAVPEDLLDKIALRYSRRWLREEARSAGRRYNSNLTMVRIAMIPVEVRHSEQCPAEEVDRSGRAIFCVPSRKNAKLHLPIPCPWCLFRDQEMSRMQQLQGANPESTLRQDDDPSQLARSGRHPVFPLWGASVREETAELLPGDAHSAAAPAASATPASTESKRRARRLTSGRVKRIRVASL